jgi:hypothetical protein
VRPIRQGEAEQMRNTLKEIASFYNPARERDSGQAAALAAREVLEQLGLFYQKDAEGPSRQNPSDSSHS